MGAKIIDGKEFAASVRAKVAEHVTRLKNDHGITPGLAVVLVGEDPASQVYVRNKGKQTLEAGMNSYEHKLDAETSETDLLALIDQLNADPAVHGILTSTVTSRAQCLTARTNDNNYQCLLCNRCTINAVTSRVRIFVYREC